tara:strand:+ start:407 stop:586 length:180 start_codon:yes stop_codon:yes gene_type:complete
MIDFISGFFSWDKSKKVEEPIDPREDIEEVKEEPKENVHTFNNKSLRGSNKDIIGEEQE